MRRGAVDGGPHERQTELGARVVDGVAGLEVVAAVEDEVVAAQQVDCVVRSDADLMALDGDVGVEPPDAVDGALDLRETDRHGVVDHLALEVGRVDVVVVDDGDRPDPGGCEVEQRGGAEPARADDGDAGVEQTALPLRAHRGQEQVTRVPRHLLGAERRAGSDEGGQGHRDDGTTRRAQVQRPGHSLRVSSGLSQPRRGADVPVP